MTNGRDNCQPSSQLRVRKQRAPAGHSETRRDTGSNRETWNWSRKNFSPSGLSAPPALGGRRRHSLGQKVFERIHGSRMILIPTESVESSGEEFPYLIKPPCPRGLFRRQFGRRSWSCTIVWDPRTKQREQPWRDLQKCRIYLPTESSSPPEPSGSIEHSSEAMATSRPAAGWQRAWTALSRSMLTLV
jgi:hypothetical protein